MCAQRDGSGGAPAAGTSVRQCFAALPWCVHSSAAGMNFLQAWTHCDRKHQRRATRPAFNAVQMCAACETIKGGSGLERSGKQYFKHRSTDHVQARWCRHKVNMYTMRIEESCDRASTTCEILAARHGAGSSLQQPSRRRRRCLAGRGAGSST